MRLDLGGRRQSAPFTARYRLAFHLPLASTTRSRPACSWRISHLETRSVFAALCFLDAFAGFSSHPHHALSQSLTKSRAERGCETSNMWFLQYASRSSAGRLRRSSGRHAGGWVSRLKALGRAGLFTASPLVEKCRCWALLKLARISSFRSFILFAGKAGHLEIWMWPAPKKRVR